MHRGAGRRAAGRRADRSIDASSSFAPTPPQLYSAHPWCAAWSRRRQHTCEGEGEGCGSGPAAAAAGGRPGRAARLLFVEKPSADVEAGDAGGVRLERRLGRDGGATPRALERRHRAVERAVAEGLLADQRANDGALLRRATARRRRRALLAALPLLRRREERLVEEQPQRVQLRAGTRRGWAGRRGGGRMAGERRTVDSCSRPSSNRTATRPWAAVPMSSHAKGSPSKAVGKRATRRSPGRSSDSRGTALASAA